MSNTKIFEKVNANKLLQNFLWDLSPQIVSINLPRIEREIIVYYESFSTFVKQPTLFATKSHIVLIEKMNHLKVIVSRHTIQLNRISSDLLSSQTGAKKKFSNQNKMKKKNYTYFGLGKFQT